MGTSRQDRHDEPFTLDDLAAAMRGMPRGALIYVRMAGGKLSPVTKVRAAHLAADGAQIPSEGAGTPGAAYAIVLEVGPGQAVNMAEEEG